MKSLVHTLLLLVCGLAIAHADGDRRHPGDVAQPTEPPMVELPGPLTSYVVGGPEIDWTLMSPPPVGTYTTLTGFVDYQSNGGSIRYIATNPANGNIHVVFSIASDSTAGGFNNSRGSVYAFSTNNGVTWNNFTNVRVPTRRSTYPQIEILRGPNAGYPVIANINIPVSVSQSMLYVDAPEGTGAFAELDAPPLVAGSDEPTFPHLAPTGDGDIVIGSTRATAATNHHNKNTGFLTWSTWKQVPGVNQAGGRTPTATNGTGRVGVLANTNNGSANRGNWWIQSTDNGLTWPTFADTIYGPFRWDGPDSVVPYVHSDVVYHGNDPMYVFSEFSRNTPTSEPRISFWSAATGWKTIVTYDTTQFIKALNRDQRFHSYSFGWPSMGLSGNTIFVTFQAFQNDTDSRGYNYSDIWYVLSNNLGVTWSAPARLTNTANLDERYPSVSKWNPVGVVNMVWQEKNKSGLASFPGTADTVRVWQIFYQHILSDVGGEPGLARGFKLNQNYPNPFNPSTRITYAIPAAAHVNLSVYNVLGQKVATLVDERREAGSFEADFYSTGLPSGVYFYSLKAGGYTDTKKMMLLK